MKILAHIHTHNNEDVIERGVRCLLDQTRPVDRVNVVDNASTDGTRDIVFPPGVTVVRHDDNRGTSGAIRASMELAVEEGYDWIWIMDADSAARPDALEKLLKLWESLPEDVRERTWRLSSLALEQPSDSVTWPVSLSLLGYRGSDKPKLRHGVVFTRHGYYRVAPRQDEAFYECDATIWAGCLFRMEAVKEIGFPPADYVLDWGEYEYGYRGKLAGYRGFMDQRSIFDHNVHGRASIQFVPHKIGPVTISLVEMKPLRAYYIIRNVLYFWLYEFRPRSLRALLPRLYKILILTLNFMVRPFSRREHIIACFRGIRDGLLKKMDRRY